MHNLTFVAPGLLEWREAPEPVLRGEGEALVRPIAATTCDLDRLLIYGETPFRGPLAIGHECVAEVVDLGDGVSGLEPGQRVVVPWHISCGECGRCRAGLTAHCEAVPYGAMFGLPVGGEWGGLFSDLVRVPFARTMLVPVPAFTDPSAVASAGDNLALALESVERHLEQRPGANVLILGFGSVGLYTAELALALGAKQVLYVDDDPKRRELACALGAAVAEEPPEREAATFELIVDASANERWLCRALQLLEPEGVCECPAIYFNDVALPLFEMVVRGVRLHTGRGNARPHIPRVLALIESGAIHPERVASEVLPWEEAPDALAEPSLKPVFVRDSRATASSGEPARGHTSNAIRDQRETKGE